MARNLPPRCESMQVLELRAFYRSWFERADLGDRATIPPAVGASWLRHERGTVAARGFKLHIEKVAGIGAGWRAEIVA